MPNANTSAAALPLVVAVVVLFFFVAKPELYNSASAYFKPGGVARARTRAIRAMWLGMALLLLGVFGSVVLKSVFARSLSLVDQLQLGGGFLVVSGGAALCGGLFAWCTALFLKRA